MLFDHLGEDMQSTSKKWPEIVNVFLHVSKLKWDYWELLIHKLYHIYTKKLRLESKEFSFSLNTAFYDSKNFELGVRYYQDNHPDAWALPQ